MQPALTPTRLVLRPLAADDGPHLADIFAGAEARRYLFDNRRSRRQASRRWSKRTWHDLRPDLGSG